MYQRGDILLSSVSGEPDKSNTAQIKTVNK